MADALKKFTGGWPQN